MYQIIYLEKNLVFFFYNIDYFVYTDGACLNNGLENAIAGIGIYFGEDDIRNVSRNINGKQSNNIAELQAIIDVYDIIKDDLVNKKIRSFNLFLPNNLIK